MRRLLVLPAALLVLASSAQPARATGFHVVTGIRDGRVMYALKRRPVLIEAARPFPAKGLAIGTVTRRGRRVRAMRSALHGRVGAEDGIRMRFTPRFTGVYTIQIVLYKLPDRIHPVRSLALAVRVVQPSARFGSRGLSVRLLQDGLRALAYAAPLNGVYDDATGRAVLAFRKVNGMARTEAVTPAIYEKLFAGLGGFRLRHPRAGRHVEFDWSRQVLVLAQAGRPVAIYHASSGKPSTPTVFGTFRFYSKTPGTNAEGMVDSNYFFRGYAVHGYPEVPPYAASHGCIRVPIPDAPAIFAWIRLGETIFVYR